MRNVKNLSKKAPEGREGHAAAKSETRMLRALWRILASQRAQEPAPPAAQKRDEDGGDLEWHLRMMS